jgi:hypothetical protein
MRGYKGRGRRRTRERERGLWCTSSWASERGARQSETSTIDNEAQSEVQDVRFVKDVDGMSKDDGDGSALGRYEEWWKVGGGKEEVGEEMDTVAYHAR